MQTLTEMVLNLAPPGGVFDETVVCNLFPTHSVGARRLLVHRAVRCGEIHRLRPGLFVVEKRFRRGSVHPFALAALLHYPSQVSFESALAFHGLIPDVVPQVACSTDRRSRSFHTPLGGFSFYRVPCNDLRAGVAATALGESSWAFIATPLRALADLLYRRREVTWPRDGLAFLTQSLRIEEDDLQGLEFDCFEEILTSVRSRRTRTYLRNLRKAVGR